VKQLANKHALYIGVISRLRDTVESWMALRYATVDNVEQGSSISCPPRPNNWPAEQRHNAKDIYYISITLTEPEILQLPGTEHYQTEHTTKPIGCEGHQCLVVKLFLEL